MAATAQFYYRYKLVQSAGSSAQKTPTCGSAPVGSRADETQARAAVTHYKLDSDHYKLDSDHYMLDSDHY